MRLLGKEVLWGAATGLPPVLTSLSVKKARLGCRKVKEEPTPSRQKLPEPKPIQGCRDRRGEQSSQEGTWARAGEGEIEDDGQPRLGCLVRSVASWRGRQEWYGLGNRVREVSANPHRA